MIYDTMIMKVKAELLHCWIEWILIEYTQYLS